jgi:serine/threonine-protein kinase RCK2
VPQINSNLPTRAKPSAMQNLKNFIRHGKQARVGNPPHGDPTTNISPVHAHHQQRQAQTAEHHAIGEPQTAQHIVAPPGGDYSAANVDNRNVGAHAGGHVAKAAGDGQRVDGPIKNYDNAVLERIIAEEREVRGKLPRYPGLERWILVEKMGDGAFSNVYRARDNTGELGEVAIKVVRKFEMNANQVRLERSIGDFLCLTLGSPHPMPAPLVCRSR